MRRTLVIHDPSGLGQGITSDVATGQIIKSNPVVSPHNFLKQIIPVNCKFQIILGGQILYSLNGDSAKINNLNLNIPLQLIKYHGIIINYEPIDETKDFDILCVYGQESNDSNFYVEDIKILVIEGMVGFSKPFN